MTGLNIVARGKNGSMLTQVAKWNGFDIGMIKSERAKSPAAEFLPTNIHFDGTKVWDFKKSHPNYAGLAKLTSYESDLLIILCHGHKLDMVIPVSELPKITWLPDGLFTCSRSVKEIMQLKEKVADALNMKAWWNESELALHNGKATIADDQAEEARVRAIRQEAVARIRSEITERPHLVVYTEHGAQLEGTPVVGDEWKHLPNLWKCVHVGSYDSLAKKASGIISWFRVTRESGNPEISKEVDVSGIPPKKQTATVHHINSGRAQRDQKKRERSAADAARRLNMQGNPGGKKAKSN